MTNLIQNAEENKNANTTEGEGGKIQISGDNKNENWNRW